MASSRRPKEKKFVHGKSWDYPGSRLYAFRLWPNEVEAFQKLVDEQYNGVYSVAIRDLILKATSEK